MAADSAVMVIDASKGVEAQTRKLFKVCVMRHIPIFTFINKMDRDAMDTFELLDDIEKELGIATCPVNWPIGSGKAFKGVYDRQKNEVELFLIRRRVHVWEKSRYLVPMTRVLMKSLAMRRKVLWQMKSNC